MARLARLVVPNYPHHVIQRGNGGQLIFRDEADYAAFLHWVRDAARQFKLAVHAYVLMPDHFHLLASPSDETGLARMMQWIGRYYVPYFNHKYGRNGTLWQGRFKATVIDPDAYFLACLLYIEFNPVRSELSGNPAHYPWSSYAHHSGIKPDPLITDHVAYWALGNTPFEREAAYRKMVEQGENPEQVASIRHATNTGWLLGGEQFKENVARLSSRRISPAKKGRPKKAPKNINESSRQN